MFLGVLMLILAAAPIVLAQSSGAGPYHYLTTIKVGGEARWDYGSVDPEARRLYYTHGSSIVVIDIDKDVVVGTISDTPGVHGFAIAADLGLGFASNGTESKASIVDLKTLATKMKVDTGSNPDPILYDPSRKEVYTFNGRSNDATVFEAQTGKVIATVPLEGKPESAQVDVTIGRVYVNIEDKNEVAVIDTKTHKVVANWPIAPGAEASGMAMDQDNHRLFLGADELMVMMDYITGKVVTTVPIGPGVDANRYDPALKLAFASCGGDGTVTIAREENANKLTVAQVLKTSSGARTMALDPKTHKIYLASADFEAPAAQSTQTAQGQRGPRAKTVPDSYKILVYGTDEK